MICHAGYTPFNHFCNAQKHAPINILLRQVGFHRPDIFVKPILLRYILGQIAEEHHWRMRMCVDKTGNSQETRRINNLDFGINSEAVGLPDSFNFVTLH